MTPHDRLVIIANNKHTKSNFELLERLEREIETDLPKTIILDPNAEQELLVKTIRLYDDTKK